MSWVAEPNAANKANPTKGVSESCGLLHAMPNRPAMTAACASNNQLRRLPSSGVNSGKGKRSTKGAHAHLKPYASPTQLRKPMVERSIPASRSRKLSVPNTSKSGKPAENPKTNMRKLLGLR